MEKATKDLIIYGLGGFFTGLIVSYVIAKVRERSNKS
jgi:hypothetical protein